MIVVKKRDLVATAAERFLAAHSGWNGWIDRPDIDQKKEMYAELCKLPADAEAEQVVAIVGHDGLVKNICHECGRDSEVTVGMGSEPHHATDTKFFCPTCLEKALALAQSAECKTLQG
jgi:hypothetical protein